MEHRLCVGCLPTLEVGTSRWVGRLSGDQKLQGEDCGKGLMHTYNRNT